MHLMTEFICKLPVSHSLEWCNFSQANYMQISLLPKSGMHDTKWPQTMQLKQKYKYGNVLCATRGVSSEWYKSTNLVVQADLLIN